jgi:2-iminobutanoate/2-iminopropanoate deaminase
MKTIHTDQAPAAIGPYSQAMVSGGLVFTSGQIPADPASGEIVGANVTAQAEQAMQNLARTGGGGTGLTVERQRAFFPAWRTSPRSTRFTANNDRETARYCVAVQNPAEKCALRG